MNRPVQVNECGHPTRKHRALRKCSPCYVNHLKSMNRIALPKKKNKVVEFRGRKIHLSRQQREILSAIDGSPGDIMRDALADKLNTSADSISTHVSWLRDILGRHGLGISFGHFGYKIIDREA